MKILLFLMLMVSFSVSAKNDTDFALYVGAKSYHYDRRNPMHEENPSIGFEYRDFTAIYIHKNSYGNPSGYFLYTPEFYVNDVVEFGGAIGGAIGYHETEYYKDVRFKNPYLIGELLPVVGLTSTVKYENVGLNLMITPFVSTVGVLVRF